jgi:lipoprotein-anchoring transpeptidase ErfK/SrfK
VPAVLVLPVMLALAGCEPSARADAAKGSSSASASASASAAASPTTTVPGPAITTNARNAFPIADPLTVSAPTGKLLSVTVTSPYGTLTGQLNAAGTQWTSSAERAPDVQYHLTATATNAGGGNSTLDRTFSAGTAESALTADVDPYGNAEVGVGQPIVIRLSTAVGKSHRAEIEKALVVTADKPIGPASWYWWSSTELHYRPKDFWPAHSKVQVAVNLAGVQGGAGLWGTKNRTVSFGIGRSFVMRIANSTHRMTVTVDGKLVRTVPISMGRPGYETRSGIKTVMSHEQSVHMTSASYGGKDVYDETVYYAQRLTWSGEYLHSAPWSVYAQGNSNVSHGCVNIGPSNAIWLFNQTLVGDPVITTGTGRQMEPGNGTGGDWDISWANWLAGSALN